MALLAECGGLLCRGYKHGPPSVVKTERVFFPTDISGDMFMDFSTHYDSDSSKRSNETYPTGLHPVRGDMFIDFSTHYDSDAVRRGGTKLEQYRST
jgi:hypothetical protein